MKRICFRDLKIIQKLIIGFAAVLLVSVGCAILSASLLEDIDSSRIWSAAAGLFAAVLGTFAFSIFAARILKPLKQLDCHARRVAQGDFQSQFEIRRNDEIGSLADSISGLVRDAQTFEAAAEAISRGVLNPETPGRNLLSGAFADVRSSIDEVRRLIRLAEEGDLAARGDTEKCRGLYRDLVQAINGMMERIAVPVGEACATLQAVAKRDLRVRMEGEYQGEYSRLKEVLNEAVSSLDRGVAQVASNASDVAEGAGQIYCSSQVFATGAREQVSTLKSVSSSLAQMSTAIEQNCASVQQGKDLAVQARVTAEKGFESMRRLSDAISRIKASSDATARIVKTIDEIAFQTNLLALNAAVEAARAGESGKGFAVVAEEVRGLAMRSAEAARNTSALIQESVRNAEAGVTINQEAMKNLEDVNSEVNLVSQVITEIADSSDRQKKGVSELNVTMNQLDKMTQQYISNSNESIASSEALSGRAESMQDLLVSFQLSSNPAQDGLIAKVNPNHAQINQKLINDAIQWEY